MRNVLFITTSPVAGGNGDALAEAAMQAARETGAEVARADLRDLDVAACKACHACMRTGECVQKDDFQYILSLAAGSDGIVLLAPVYFNLPYAGAVALLSRFFCIFSPAREAREAAHSPHRAQDLPAPQDASSPHREEAAYSSLRVQDTSTPKDAPTPKDPPVSQDPPQRKKLAVLLTLSGSDPAKMRETAMGAAGFFENVAEIRVELFERVSRRKGRTGAKAGQGREDGTGDGVEDTLSRIREIGQWAASI